MLSLQIFLFLLSSYLVQLLNPYFMFQQRKCLHIIANDFEFYVVGDDFSIPCVITSIKSFLGRIDQLILVHSQVTKAELSRFNKSKIFGVMLYFKRNQPYVSCTQSN